MLELTSNISYWYPGNEHIAGPHLRVKNLMFFIVQVEMLKHGIPDPSSHVSSQFNNTNVVSEKNKVLGGEEYMAASVFVHTK